MAKVFKDLKALAAGLGLKLYDARLRRRQLQQQLECVKGLMGAPDFPKRGKLGWPVEEVKAWAEKRVKISANQRQLESAQVVPAPNGDLPKQANAPGPEIDLFEGMTPAQMQKRRLDILQEKCFFPERHPLSKISKFELDELRAARPHLFRQQQAEPAPNGGESAAEEGNEDLAEGGMVAMAQPAPKYCTGLERLCGHIRQRWPDYNLRVSKQMIQHWQQGRGGVPHGAPFFPAYDAAGRYVLQDCLDWFERFQLPKYRRMRQAGQELPNLEESVPLETLKELDERAELEHRRFERARERDEYVHRSVARASGIAAVRRLHALVKAADERGLPRQRKDKLVSLGVSPEIAAQFEVWDVELGRRLTDERESAMMAASVTSGPLDPIIKT